jgi:hypothetical protein
MSSGLLLSDDMGPLAGKLTTGAVVPPSLAEHVHDMAGREWVLQVITDWFEHSSERFLLLTGEPGSGKTALAAWLAGAGELPRSGVARRQLQRLRETWTAFHFCVAQDQGGTLDPFNFVALLTDRITRRLPQYGDIVLKQLQAAHETRIENLSMVNYGTMVGAVIHQLVISLDAEGVYNRAVRKPLEAMADAMPGLQLLILIDGIDEAKHVAEPNILNLLWRSHDLPDGVRFVLTSRNDTQVLSGFKSMHQVDLSADSVIDKARDDICTYAARRLNRLPPAGAPIDPELPRRLATAAAGNFLYVKLLLDEIETGRRSPDDLIGVPQKLPEFYGEYLTRLIPGASDARFNQVWPEYQSLLGCLSVATPAAPHEQLPGWLDADAGPVNADLNVLEQLVE